jgi:hypothetical protein
MAGMRIWVESSRITCSTRGTREGRHKARMFASVFGIARDNQDILANALREAASNSTEAISTGGEGFGATFEIRFRLTTNKGTAVVLSAWIIRNGEDFPRLTSCFII